jgi:hypothetical protein
MLRYVIPLLLLSSFAQAEEGNPLKLYHHFDPITGFDGTDAPQLKGLLSKPIVVPTNLGGKCSTDDLKVVSTYLHSVGYTALMTSIDKNNPEIMKEIMYNLQDNSILSLSLVHDHNINKDEDKPEDNKLIKICLDYQGESPFADGPTMKKFILGQHMDMVTHMQNDEDEHKRKLSSGVEGEEHQEPYQGDPSKVDYIP